MPPIPAVLEAAGIADTDMLVALTSSDEVNMVACEIAHALYRTPTKIARIRAPEYTSHDRLFREGMLAVDVWINPEQLVTEYIERLIQQPRRVAGGGFRRRPRAPRGHAGAATAACWWASSCAR